MIKLSSGVTNEEPKKQKNEVNTLPNSIQYAISAYNNEFEELQNQL